MAVTVVIIVTDPAVVIDAEEGGAVVADSVIVFVDVIEAVEPADVLTAAVAKPVAIGVTVGRVIIRTRAQGIV